MLYILQEYRRYGIPLVLIGRIFDSYLSDGSLPGDNEKGLLMSTKYIIGHGNRRILYLEGNLATSGAMQRMAGYRRALSDAEIPYDDQLVHSGEFSIQYGYQAVQRVREMGVAFDAVVTGSDLIAIGAVKALQDAGLRVWQDVEVIGFDNISVSKYVEGGITTIANPYDDMISIAINVLTKREKNRQSSRQQIALRPKLIVRSTT